MRKIFPLLFQFDYNLQKPEIFNIIFIDIFIYVKIFKNIVSLMKFYTNIQENQLQTKPMSNEFKFQLFHFLKYKIEFIRIES